MNKSKIALTVGGSIIFAGLVGLYVKKHWFSNSKDEFDDLDLFDEEDIDDMLNESSGNNSYEAGKTMNEEDLERDPNGKIQYHKVYEKGGAVDSDNKAKEQLEKRYSSSIVSENPAEVETPDSENKNIEENAKEKDNIENSEQNVGDIYAITDKEFDELEDQYDKDALLLYSDGIIADESGEIKDTEIIGKDIIDHIVANIKNNKAAGITKILDSTFVINKKLNMAFEVVFVDMTYAEAK